MRTIEEVEKELNDIRQKIDELLAQEYELQKERLEMKFLDKFPIGKRVKYEGIEYEIYKYDGEKNSVVATIITNTGRHLFDCFRNMPEWVLKEILEQEKERITA